MNMISVVNKKGKLIISNKLVPSEEVNLREMDLISRGMVSGLISVTASKQKKASCLECTIEDKISLSDYFSNIMSKKIFLDIVFQIIKMIKNCDKNMMYVKNLVLDVNYIFMDLKTKELFFIYWPIVNSQASANVAEFFSNMAFKAIFDRHEDTGYVSDYIRYFKSGEGFSFANFEKFIMQLLGISSEQVQHFAATGPTSKGNTHNTRENTTNSLQSKVAYYPPAEGTSEITSPSTVTEYNSPSQNKKTSTQNFSETTLLGEEDDSNGGTTVLGDEEWVDPTFPYIIREKTGEKIDIDKPNFRIGKEKRFCDYFISDNNAISRSHADIITRNNHYYIYDNNSTNKTYVGGRAIPVQKEVELFSGTKLKLANEEFTFYI